MPIQTEKLLVLKAFYMGRAISEKKKSISVALDMVETAIRKFAAMNDNESKLRLLFYLLLKAEILRETPKVVEIRASAREVSQQIGGSVFDYFMAVEENTQSRKKVYAMHVGVITDEDMNRTDNYTPSDGSNVWTVRYAAACKALGVDGYRLTEKENHFLRDVTLKEMLEKHRVEYATH